MFITPHVEQGQGSFIRGSSRVSRFFVAVSFFCMSAASPSVSAYQPDTLYNPKKVSVVGKNGQELTPDQMESIVKSVTGVYQWQITSIEPNKINASYSKGRTSASIEITYDTKSVSIRHLNSSANLFYKKDQWGDETIHPTYNRWIRNLVVKMQKEAKTRH